MMALARNQHLCAHCHAGWNCPTRFARRRELTRRNIAFPGISFLATII
jgi:hypothetical protein